jgi:hypothetical protein
VRAVYKDRQEALRVINTSAQDSKRDLAVCTAQRHNEAALEQTASTAEQDSWTLAVAVLGTVEEIEAAPKWAVRTDDQDSGALSVAVLAAVEENKKIDPTAEQGNIVVAGVAVLDAVAGNEAVLRRSARIGEHGGGNTKLAEGDLDAATLDAGMAAEADHEPVRADREPAGNGDSGQLLMILRRWLLVLVRRLEWKIPRLGPMIQRQ